MTSTQMVLAGLGLLAVYLYQNGRLRLPARSVQPVVASQPAYSEPITIASLEDQLLQGALRLREIQHAKDAHDNAARDKHTAALSLLGQPGPVVPKPHDARP